LNHGVIFWLDAPFDVMSAELLRETHFPARILLA
jgi:hypothetical protein